MKRLTINFQPEYKLWLACEKPSANALRPILEYVFFKDGFAYASNAHILARVPLELCTTFDEEQRAILNGFSIHSSLLKFIVGFDRVEVGKQIITQNGTDKVVATLTTQSGDNTITITLSDTLNITPPDFDAVLFDKAERKPIRDIGLRTKYLADLTAAMGAENIKMGFTTASNKIYVEPTQDATEGFNVMGIIMPIMIEQTLPGFGEPGGEGE